MHAFAMWYISIQCNTVHVVVVKGGRGAKVRNTFPNPFGYSFSFSMWVGTRETKVISSLSGRRLRRFHRYATAAEEAQEKTTHIRFQHLLSELSEYMKCMTLMHFLTVSFKKSGSTWQNSSIPQESLKIRACWKRMKSSRAKQATSMYCYAAFTDGMCTIVCTTLCHCVVTQICAQPLRLLRWTPLHSGLTAVHRGYTCSILRIFTLA